MSNRAVLTLLRISECNPRSTARLHVMPSPLAAQHSKPRLPALATRAPERDCWIRKYQTIERKSTSLRDSSSRCA